MEPTSPDSPLCSVVICTHNPRREYLVRVLEALRKQSLSHDHWELIVVDNASEQPVKSWADIAWHPRSRTVQELELGLTPARLKGISEAHGDIVVFVDDDNVLARDYVERAAAIGRAWPMLGSWGAGVILPEFEVAPPRAVQPYIRWLALRDEPRDLWANNPVEHSALPWGAGICVRREVGIAYAKECAITPLGRMLDRRGGNLASAGDCLLALSARHLGMGWGVFRALQITHLIPAFRVTEGYILRMAEQMTESNHLLHYIVDQTKYQRPRRIRDFLSLTFHNIRLTLIGNGFPRSVMNAVARGVRRANRIIDGLRT